MSRFFAFFLDADSAKSRVAILSHGSIGRLKPPSEATAVVLTPHFFARKHHTFTLTKRVSVGQRIFAAERYLQYQDLDMKMLHQVVDNLM